MARILLTGMAGTGKSSALAELERRGYRVVDTDEPGWKEYRPYPQPVDELHRGEWHWVEDRMAELLDAEDDRTLFVGGGASNQSSFYDRFDAVVLLSAPIDVILHRVSGRTTNEYGKAALDRAEMVVDLRDVEPRLRRECTHALDATRPLGEIVDELIAIAASAEAAAD